MRAHFVGRILTDLSLYPHTPRPISRSRPMRLMSDTTDKVMEVRVKGMEDTVKSSMSYFEKSVAGLAKTYTVNAVEKTLKTEVGAIEKTLKTEVGEKTAAIEKTLKAEVGAIEKTLKADMASVEKVVTGKLDAMNNVVWRFAGVLILTALLAPNIRDVWAAPKKSE